MDKFAFCFPGQGTQFMKMGKTFYDHWLIAKQTYAEARDTAGYDIAQICFNGSFSYTNMQIAIVTTEVAIFRSYMEDYGIPPQLMVGHSIGEYAALVCSGAINFSDCIKMLLKRGDMAQKILDKAEGRMTILQHVTEKQVAEKIKEAGIEDSVSISCYNSPTQFAVSGKNDALEVLENELMKINAVIIPLLQSPPMHSPMMEEIRGEFKTYLESFSYYPFEYPVLSNLTGRPVTDGQQIPFMLSEHLIRPVQFTKSIKFMQELGAEIVIEMSPKCLLSSLVKVINPEAVAFCYGLEKDRDELHDFFQKEPNYAKDRTNFLGSCLCLLEATPNHNPNNDNIRVTEIYNKIKKEYIEDSKFNRSQNQDGQVLKLVIEALQTKHIPDDEIFVLVRSVLHRTNKMYVYENLRLV